jgi:hypothetical protein
MLQLFQAKPWLFTITVMALGLLIALVCMMLATGRTITLPALPKREPPKRNDLPPMIEYPPHLDRRSKPRQPDVEWPPKIRTKKLKKPRQPAIMRAGPSGTGRSSTKKPVKRPAKALQSTPPF